MDRPGVVDILRLADGWMLRADECQWILARRNSRTRGDWQHVSFVATTKAILERCMREAGCVPDKAGAAAFGALSPNFRAWRAQQTLAALPAVTVRVEPASHEEAA